jgi:hypothetical protein
MNRSTNPNASQQIGQGESHRPVPPPISVGQFGQAFGSVFGQAMQNLYTDVGTYFGGNRNTGVLGNAQPVDSGPTATEDRMPVITPAQKVAPIIEKVEDENARRTLKSVDPRMIQAVGRTVNKARLRYPEITDREIYLLFHRATSGVDPDPALLEGRKVLDLLMGGLRGEIPF